MLQIFEWRPHSSTWRRYSPTVCVLVAVILLALFADHQSQTIEMQNERDRVRTQLETLEAQIERSLNSPIQASRGLVAALSTEPNMEQARFEWLGSRIIDPSTGVRNIAGARDLVVNLVYPMEGNASAVGLDYNQHEEQREAAYHVRDTGEFILAGPVELVQGGQAFIGRFPVFSENNGSREFWGILSIVIDLPTLYLNAGLTDPGLGLEIALVGRDGQGASGERFLGSAELASGDAESTGVLFPNGSWELYARPVGGWGSTVFSGPFRFILIVLGFGAMSLTAMTNHMSVQRKYTIRTLQSRETELEASRQQVEVLALHDHLTGLPNRRFLDRELKQLIGTSCFGLIQLDLDGFKEINDTQGHAVGDQLLVKVAERLKCALPPGTFLARSGGDEFVVICLLAGSDMISHKANRDKLESVSEKLIDSVQQPFFDGWKKGRIGMSAGIHQIASEKDLDPDEWLTQADNAMYCAKQAGRNRTVFSSSISNSSTDGHQCAEDLLEALNNGQIVPFYQPQFAVDGRSLVGVEALARWRHPERGIYSPKDFMNLARSLKIDCEIDHCIFVQAITDLKRWDWAGLAVPRISVNMSFRRLNDPHLIDAIDSIGADPGRVTFELLESIFLDDGDHALISNVDALKARGFGIEIDDFGTGHSSATSLLRLRPQCLKIDKGLVQAAQTSRQNRRLLATIAEMGHALNIEVCAEGIETPEQLLTARAVGCTRMQGFYLARPMSAEHLEEFLSGSSRGELDKRAS